MQEFIVVYVTTPNRRMAEDIAAMAIESRLAACANILGDVNSVYRWQGQVEKTDEVALILKTRAELFDPLAQKIRDLHSYDCPCIVSWPLQQGTPDYLDWLGASLDLG